jgi:hypothetical protein
MAGERHGPWEALALSEVVRLFEDSSARWWISDEHALELHLGRSWRTHDDMDVGVLRGDASVLALLLEGRDIEIAAASVLSPWNGSVPLAQERQNNLWCRERSDQPLCVDINPR